MSQQVGTPKKKYVGRLLAKLNINLPPLPPSPPSHQPTQITLLQLAALIGLAVLLHFSIADLIVASFALFIYLLKLTFVLSKKRAAAPPQLVNIVLTIISIILIIMLYGGWNGQRAGISFLVLLVSLKFLESRTLRDYYVVCLILFFLAASSFLFNSSIANITAALIYTLAIIGIMLKLSNPTEIDWKPALSSATGIIGKALPLAIILFFFFPRIHGSFGFLPGQDKNQFENELNNTLVAGDIATAAFNNKLAFRVEFDGPTPSNHQLYWRSKVMPNEDNFTWTVRPPSPSDIRNAKEKIESLAIADKKNLTRYTILHESSTDLFLPYLAYVAEFSRGRFLNDYSIWQPRAQSTSFTYQGSSILAPSIAELSQVNIQPLIDTTSKPSARTQALLTKWRQLTSDPVQQARLILNHFTSNDFYYSLYPPSLDENPIDEFLFDSKTGYCEHYASVFTTLMRWLGVPARVVVGYQGGLTNQTGQYLEIRYSDAHAWSEILVDQKWIRVDPTAAISPDRIEYGMDAFMSTWDSSGSGAFAGGSSLTNYLNPQGMDRYFRVLRDNWNNVGYQWNKWVVNYDADTQRELLAKIGVDGRHRYSTMIIIMFASIGTILFFYFWRLLPQRIKRSEAQQYYLKFIARFKHAKIIKNPADTPTDFASKAITAFPHMRTEIDEITHAYLQLRYGKTSFEIKKFKQLVKKFRLKKLPR